MNIITRRNAIKVLGMGFIATTGLLATGCSSNELSPSEARGALRDSMREIPLSQALNNGRTLWFVDELDEVAKDKTFLLLVFENKKVTRFDHTSLTYGDIDGLSDDEIIELVLQASADKQREYIEEVLTGQRGFLADSTDPVESEFYTELIDYLESIGDYEPPLPGDYKLHIYTDQSGNYVEREVLDYTYLSTPIRQIGKMVENRSVELDTEPGTASGRVEVTTGAHAAVYNTNFGGLSGKDYALLTRVEDSSTVFVLDELGTEGVEVD